jgi:hypothetical protein
MGGGQLQTIVGVVDRGKRLHPTCCARNRLPGARESTVIPIQRGCEDLFAGITFRESESVSVVMSWRLGEANPRLVIRWRCERLTRHPRG